MSESKLLRSYPPTLKTTPPSYYYHDHRVYYVRYVHYVHYDY